MRLVLRTGVAALVLAALAGPAGADMSVYYHTGSWDAFSGPGADGKPVCGIGSTNPVDNRSFSMRFAIGGDSVAFQAKKPNWSIPAGAQLPVVVQIGLDTPWNLQGSGQRPGGGVVARSYRGADVRCAVPPRRFHDCELSLGQRTALDGRAERLDRDQQCIRPLRDRHDGAGLGTAARAGAVGPDAALWAGADPADHAGTDAAHHATIGGER